MKKATMSLALVLTLGLASCGNNQQERTDGTVEGPENPTINTDPNGPSVRATDSTALLGNDRTDVKTQDSTRMIEGTGRGTGTENNPVNQKVPGSGQTQRQNPK